MECISPSHVPVIVQSGPGQDWARQHILGEQLCLDRAKQAKRPAPFTAHAAVSMRTWASRQSNVGRRAVLHIPGTQPRARVEKHAVLRTPMKSTKSTQEWEDLLRSSISSLQGLYARIEPPAPRRSQGLGDRLARPDLAGLDRTEMVSRALQAAVGCASHPGSQDCYEGDSSGTEDSYSSDDTPATPDTVRTSGDVNIDPRLFG